MTVKRRKPNVVSMTNASMDNATLMECIILRAKVNQPPEPLFWAYSKCGEPAPEKVRNEVAAKLWEAAPGFSIADKPLDMLAWLIMDIEIYGKTGFPNWLKMETGFPAARNRRERIEHLAKVLLSELENDEKDDTPDLKSAVTESLGPVRRLKTLARHELDHLPSAQGAIVWKSLARIFYNLAVQAWIEGGADFFKGAGPSPSVPQFGIGRDGKATAAVVSLLGLTGKHLSSNHVADFLNELRGLEGDPLPWPLPWALSWPVPWPLGKDYLALRSGLWGLDCRKRRKRLERNVVLPEDQVIQTKKKRGRPRGS